LARGHLINFLFFIFKNTIKKRGRKKKPEVAQPTPWSQGGG
jgi:hypothetical protein